MLNMMMTLPSGLKSAVMPVLNPTVPKALTSSKIKSMMPRFSIAKMCCSDMDNMNIAKVFPTKKNNKTL